MILAEEFSRHPKARDSDFSTNSEERGVFQMTPRLAGNETYIRGALVCQLAASHSSPLADAAELVSPYVDGIDLNCGCPQPWAYEERIGSYLLEEPELVADMIRAVKGRLGDAYCVSVKIRIDPDLRYVARYATFLYAHTLAAQTHRYARPKCIACGCVIHHDSRPNSARVIWL